MGLEKETQRGTAEEQARGSGPAVQETRMGANGCGRAGLEDESGLVPTTRKKKREQVAAEERKSTHGASTSKPTPEHSLFTAE